MKLSDINFNRLGEVNCSATLISLATVVRYQAARAGIYLSGLYVQLSSSKRYEFTIGSPYWTHDGQFVCTHSPSAPPAVITQQRKIEHPCLYIPVGAFNFDVDNAVPMLAGIEKELYTRYALLMPGTLVRYHKTKAYSITSGGGGNVVCRDRLTGHVMNVPRIGVTLEAELES